MNMQQVQNFEVMFKHLKPSVGVKFVDSKGDVKSGSHSGNDYIKTEDHKVHFTAREY
jgi:hypothetical protein